MTVNPCLVFVRTFRYRASIYAKGPLYPKLREEIKKTPLDLRISTQYERLKTDLKKWWQICKFRFSNPPRTQYMHSQAICVATFDSPESIKGWSAGDDRWEGVGESKSEISYDPVSKCAVFSGNLSSDILVSVDGVISRKGFASFRSPRINTLLWWAERHDWTHFTHLVLELRGDGRNWTLNLNTPGIFDIDIHDMFSYPIFTRGGPYWQVVRVPFSKFFFQNRGAIQDTPRPVYLDSIYTITFCLMDHASGPFRLDLRSVYVMRDMTHNEKHAYETYRVPNLIVTGRN